MRAEIGTKGKMQKQEHKTWSVFQEQFQQEIYCYQIQ